MLVNANVPLDAMYIIIQFLPYKYWYIDKQLGLISNLNLKVAKSKYYLARFVNRWQAAYKCRCVFMQRLQTEINYRLDFVYCHEDPRPHLCHLKPFPSPTRFGWHENPFLLFLRTNHRIIIPPQPSAEELLSLLHSVFV